MENEISMYSVLVHDCQASIMAGRKDQMESELDFEEQQGKEPKGHPWLTVMLLLVVLWLSCQVALRQLREARDGIGHDGPLAPQAPGPRTSFN